jgi:hypothetical protein
MSSSWSDGLWGQPCATPMGRMFFSSWRTKAKTRRGSACVRAAEARGSTARNPRAPHGRPFLVPKARPGARRCELEVQRRSAARALPGPRLPHGPPASARQLSGASLDFPAGAALALRRARDARRGPCARCQPAPGYRSRARSRRAFDCCLPLVDGDHGASPSSSSSTRRPAVRGTQPTPGRSCRTCSTELRSCWSRALRTVPGAPIRCERSCTKCLRHYGNRFLHGRLDRRLAHAATCGTSARARCRRSHLRSGAGSRAASAGPLP